MRAVNLNIWSKLALNREGKAWVGGKVNIIVTAPIHVLLLHLMVLVCTNCW